MEQLVMPELYCPFPSVINPSIETVEQQTIDWASRFQLIDSPHMQRRFIQAKFSRVIGRAYPNAAPADLRLICDWNTALFAWDDYCDEAQFGRQPELLRDRSDLLLDLLLSAAPTEPQDNVIRAMADVGERLRQRMPRRWVRRFVHQVQEYLEGTIWESQNRAEGIVPDLATYLRMRQFAGSLYLFFEFADLTEQIDLPFPIRKHPIVKQLTTMAANVVVWANDIFSLEKELSHGDVHNLVIALQREHQLPWQDAIDRAAELHNLEVSNFIELAMRLPVFGPAIDVPLQRYVAVLRAWMRGNIDWSHETGRYQSAWITELV